MGWLLPLGSRKVMGSFAGYSVRVSPFEIVRLFFNGFFFGSFERLFLLMLQFDGLLFWTFFPRPRTSYSSPRTYRSTFPLPQDLVDVIFWLRPCLLFRSSPEDFFFYDQPEAVLFFPCMKKTCDD